MYTIIKNSAGGGGGPDCFLSFFVCVGSVCEIAVHGWMKEEVERAHKSQWLVCILRTVHLHTL